MVHSSSVEWMNRSAPSTALATSMRARTSRRSYSNRSFDLDEVGLGQEAPETLSPRQRRFRRHRLCGTLCPERALTFGGIRRLPEAPLPDRTSDFLRRVPYRRKHCSPQYQRSKVSVSLRATVLRAVAGNQARSRPAPSLDCAERARTPADHPGTAHVAGEPPTGPENLHFHPPEPRAGPVRRVALAVAQRRCQVCLSTGYV